MERMVELFIKNLQRKNYSKATISEYERELHRFIDYLKKLGKDFKEMDRFDVEEYIFDLNIADRTQNRALSVIRSFCKFLQDRGYITENPAKQVEFAKVRTKNPVFLTDEELTKLRKVLEAEKDDLIGLRNKTIVKLFVSTGLRVSELVNLKVEDVNLDDSGAVLEVRRKGQEMDYVYVNKKTTQDLAKYLNLRKKMSLSHNYLFISKNYRPLDRSNVYRLVKNIFFKAGIEKKKMGPHVLRHTFATILMKSNVSIYKIKRLMNHKQLSTTERYLHVVEDDLRKTVEEIDI
ncbi:MAG: integrase/recombinase XerD [Thermotogaceae bacterium]|jgi:site-specific recombinase XerD|nr:integrase/recombinase XerD [Thermotogaceae bacterium]